MNRETAYVSSIPEHAREKVTQKHGNGNRKQAEYYIGIDLVGKRQFFPTGKLEGEWAFRNGVKHGWDYQWDASGKLLSAEPYEDGVEHGTAYQWASDGRLIGSYTMERGTGLDLWRQDWRDGSVDLSEARYYVDGLRHGYEWWFCEGVRLSQECHWRQGVQHGIERDWNFNGGLRRGFPRYWVSGERVTKRQYVRAESKHADLPPFHPEDNKPFRRFPLEVAKHLRSGCTSG